MKLFSTQNIYHAIKLGIVNELWNTTIEGFTQFSDRSRNTNIIVICNTAYMGIYFHINVTKISIPILYKRLYLYMYIKYLIFLAMVVSLL